MTRADRDRTTVRSAALRTGVQVAGVSTGLVLAILILAALFIVDQSRPSELLERPRRGESKIYVDSHEVLLALVVLGAAAVVVVGFASWAISRRAVEPLAEALRFQRAFVADASHELRTPLAVLSTRLQVLQRRLERGEPWREGIEGARRDADVMSDLVTDLLLLAESHAQAAVSPGAELQTGLRRAIEDLRVLADERGVTIVAGPVPPVRVSLTESGLRRAVTILLDNAVQHSPDGGVVDVTVQRSTGGVEIRVVDRGDGIPPELQPRLFERFAHGPETGRRRGFGLGLALVADLVARAGGAVQVEATSTSGTTMRLRLPLAS